MTVELLDIRPGARNVITEAANGRLRLMPLSVEQYHRMIDEGILPEDSGIELLPLLPRQSPKGRKQRKTARGHAEHRRSSCGLVDPRHVGAPREVDGRKLVLALGDPIGMGRAGPQGAGRAVDVAEEPAAPSR